MTTQLDLFGTAKVEVREPEPTTTIRLGRKSAQIPLRQQRREAIKRLAEILEELEGKDIYIGSYDAGGRHYWLDNLKLPRLQLEFNPQHLCDDQDIPGVIVLRGSKAACIRIFTNYLVDVRTQEYQGYRHYLLDFRNGFWESPIDKYYSHYACLQITKYKD